MKHCILLFLLNVSMGISGLTAQPSPTPTPVPEASAVAASTPSSDASGVSSSATPKEHGFTINFSSEDDKKDHPAGSSSESRLEDIVIPIVALVMIFGSPVALVALILFHRMKKTRLLHQTIQTLVANGHPIPPELLALSGAKSVTTANSDRRKGIIFSMIGLGLIAYFLSEHDTWGIGLIPLTIGIGYLLTSRFAPRGENNLGNKS